MEAKEFLLENIGNSNLPEEMYIEEISEMMELYGNLRYHEGRSEKSSDISPISDMLYADEHEQAMKRSNYNKIYADAYVEGLKDGINYH